MKLNERAWAGQIISWIKQAINDGTTIFQDATNDEGIKVASGRTKFPDVLLFVDKVSGIVFNGWELKFPDTEADDAEMLENALEKAERLKSDSFVTWNGVNGNQECSDFGIQECSGKLWGSIPPVSDGADIRARRSPEAFPGSVRRTSAHSTFCRLRSRSSLPARSGVYVWL